MAMADLDALVTGATTGTSSDAGLVSEGGYGSGSDGGTGGGWDDDVVMTDVGRLAAATMGTGR